MSGVEDKMAIADTYNKYNKAISQEMAASSGSTASQQTSGTTRLFVKANPKEDQDYVSMRISTREDVYCHRGLQHHYGFRPKWL